MRGSYDAEIEFVSNALARAIVERETDLVDGATAADEIVRELLRRVGSRTTGNVLGALAERVTAEAVAGGYRVERRAVVPFMTVFGVLAIQSPYLIGVAGGARPVKDRLGIVGRSKSPAVERALIDFGIEESFALAGARFYEHYGFHVGRTSILRVVEGAGREAEDYVAARLAAEPERPEMAPPDVITVQLDGSETRTATLEPRDDGSVSPRRRLPRRRRVEQWREVRVGQVTRYGEAHRIYVAKVAGYPEVVADMRRAADHLGAKEANLVVAPVDGGNGLREAIESVFHDAQIVLDWPHFRSHLFETAAEMQRGRDTVERWTSTIDAGGVDEVITELEHYASVTRRPGADRARRLAAHLDRFRDAVDYQRFRQEGLPTGCGQIEAAHRVIPQKRLKKPGAWWDPANVNPVLALRVVRANGWWEPFCAARARHHAAA
jgi:hypothetical protein